MFVLVLCDWSGVKTDWSWIKKAGITGLGPAAPPYHPQKSFPQHFHTTPISKSLEPSGQSRGFSVTFWSSQHCDPQPWWKKGYDVELSMDSTTPPFHTCGRQLDRNWYVTGLLVPSPCRDKRLEQPICLLPFCKTVLNYGRETLNYTQLWFLQAISEHCVLANHHISYTLFCSIYNQGVHTVHTVGLHSKV